jgi:hypothetical protein
MKPVHDHPEDANNTGCPSIEACKKMLQEGPETTKVLLDDMAAKEWVEFPKLKRRLLVLGSSGVSNMQAYFNILPIVEEYFK